MQLNFSKSAKHKENYGKMLAPKFCIRKEQGTGGQGRHNACNIVLSSKDTFTNQKFKSNSKYK